MIDRMSVYVTKNTNPYRNLALEEYLTFHVKPGECILFLWQNRRTVVIGKNQNCWKECHVSLLEKDGGFLVRRLSGGGAVFHDLGNLNFTFCVRREDYDVKRQLSVILKAVHSLGINAEQTGRNDLTIDGKKFSGNAFYESGDFCYHHGTLLLSADTEAMARYLTVAEEKLRSKGVDSVRARVANLGELCPGLCAEQMEKALIRACEDVYGCSAEKIADARLDTEMILKYEERFASWEWKYGRKIPFQYEVKRRFPWGEIELQFEVNGGVVRNVNAFSDGMDPALIALLPEMWQGVRYEKRMLLDKLEAAAAHTALQQMMKRDIGRLLDEEL